MEPSFDGETCTVYCHGVSLSGGTITEPSWTDLDEDQVYCGSCHSVPPTENHPMVTDDFCENCHPFYGGPENHDLHIDAFLNLGRRVVGRVVDESGA